MKKFGRKLVLSGLALAATAATLSTSTYAWYVSNTAADVDGGTAATEAGTSDGNLLVAQNVTKTGETQGKGAFSNHISLENTFNAVELNPVTKCTAGYALTTDKEKATGKTYYVWSETESKYVAASESDTDFTKLYEEAEWMDVDGKVVAAAKAYQEISFWVVSTNSSEVTIKSTVTNVTDTTLANLPQVCLNTSNAPKVSADASAATVAYGSEFYVDAAKALRFEVSYSKFVDAYTKATGEYDSEVTYYTQETDADSNVSYEKVETSSAENFGNYYVYTATESNTTLYDIDGFNTGTYTQLSGSVYGGDANAYYKDIMNKDAVGGTTVAAPGAGVKFTKLNVNPGIDTLITIRIWLEGTDADCFDSCRNQSFEYSFDLSTN